MIYILISGLIIAAIIIMLNANNTKRQRKKKAIEIENNWGKSIVKYRNIDLIKRYLNSGKFNKDLSVETTTDIDMEGLFGIVDRTCSKPGQQLLYKKLHCFESQMSNFDLLEKKISYLTNDTDLRKKIQLKLSQLNSDDAYYLPELYTKKYKPVFHPLIKSYIFMSPVLIIALVTIISIAPTGAAFLLLLATLIVNTAVHFLNKKHVFLFSHSLPQLIILSEVGLWLWKNVPKSGLETLDGVMQRISKLKRGLSFVNFHSKVNDPTDFIFLINEWFKMLLLVEPIRFLYSINKVNKNLHEIEILYEFVADIDVCISIQSFRSSLPYYCIPRILESGNNMVTEKLFHPLVENCVSNSMTTTDRNVVLITGSNMSGKTTFIKAIAVNSILAQTINTCCATIYQAPYLKILTSIHKNDDLNENTSYFQAEAMSLLGIINQSASKETFKSLVIIDEIFRGTNTIERIAAATSVLTYLAENENFVFASTHDLELAQLLGDNYTVYCFEEFMTGHKSTFDYKIKHGLLKNRNGIAVLERMNYPSNIIKNALETDRLLRQKYEL